MNVRALIPAAGVGRRFGTTLPKQYQPLAGRPILERSIARLFDCRYIDQLVVALSPNDNDWPMIAEDVRDRVSVTTGGAERADSVRLALQSMTDLAAGDWVLVHDAVRPLVSPLLIDKMLASLRPEEPGAILAVPIQDTVKRHIQSPGREPKIAETLDRSFLWAAQTPQVFQYGLLREALEKTQGDPAVTDEASAMEMCGHAVRLIEGDRQNMKITSQQDLQLAELLWAQQHVMV